jgi:hypothetical protein
MALQSCLEVFFCVYAPKTTVSMHQNLLNFSGKLTEVSEKVPEVFKKAPE